MALTTGKASSQVSPPPSGIHLHRLASLGPALHRLPRARPLLRPELVEQRLGRLSRHHLVRHRVGVDLVGVAGLADATRELHAGTLLDDMCGLVGGGVEVRRAAKGDVFAGGEGRGPQRIARGGGGAVLVAVDRGDVVPAEGGLDQVQEGKCAARAGRALGGEVLDVAGGFPGGPLLPGLELALPKAVAALVAPTRSGRRACPAFEPAGRVLGEVLVGGLAHAHAVRHACSPARGLQALRCASAAASRRPATVGPGGLGSEFCRNYLLFSQEGLPPVSGLPDTSPHRGVWSA